MERQRNGTILLMDFTMDKIMKYLGSSFLGKYGVGGIINDNRESTQI
jgi:hypothetical protein